MSTRPALRSVRGVLTGTICGLGATVAHQLAGGAYAPVAALAIWPISVVLATWLVTRRVSPTRALLAAIGTQAVWHLLLAVSGGSHTGHHQMPAMHGAHDMDGMHGMQGTDAASGHPMLGMYLAHAAVAVVAAGVALGADRALLALLFEWLLPALRPTTPVPVPHRARVSRRLARPRDRWRAGPRTGRGPPLVLAR